MAADTDGDLLFGLLALQNGLIDQVQLVAAFQAWTRDKMRRLADHLVARGDLDADQRSGINAIVSLHLKKHGGDPAASLAAVNAGRSTRARLAQLGDPEIEATLGHVGSGSTEAESDEAAADRTGTYYVGSPTSDGRRFRVLRPHARGALGAVFVALDGELHREVALKQILDHHADDPVSRARFLIEAEITGGLEHPGIVPVYGLGTFDNGRPYYAMRFIRGDSLKQASDRFHADASLKDNPGARGLELRKLLRRFLDVCDAIHYAHGRGVIHRDLKPSNVVLGNHGETLVVDWGLAKAVGHTQPGASGAERALVPSSASGSADTIPGSALGTPAYMSPEQATGDLDLIRPASDIYSLGATLYYVLTGKLAFQGDVGQVLQAVQAGEFPPVRSVAPWVDPALEAVCHMAMARRPEKRYESARALALDVERWMADEPVTAYRAPLRARIARWERRHKPLVYGAAAVVLIAMVGLAITASVAREQKIATDVARRNAEAKAVEADTNFNRAVDAAFQFFSRVSDQQLAKVPGTESIRRDLSDKAVTAFRDFLKTKPDDYLTVWRASRVFRDTAIVRAMLGDLQEARDLHQDAIKQVERLSNLRDGTKPQPIHRLLLAKTLGDFAHFLRENGHDGEANAHRARARTLVDGLVAESPDDVQFQAEFTRMALNQVGGWLSHDDGMAALDEGDRERARRSFRQAIELLTPVARLPNSWVWHQLRVAQAHRGLAMLAHEEGDEKVADRQFAESLRLIRAEVAAHPTEDGPRHVLGTTLEMNGRRLMSDPARGAEADAAFAEANEVTTRLVSESPGVAWYHRLHAEILLGRAGREAASRRDDRAEKDLTAALGIFQKLERTRSFDLTSLGHIGRGEVALGPLRIRQGRAADGRMLIDEGVSHLEAACQNRPTSVRERASLVEAQTAQGQIEAAASPKAGK